MYLVCLHVSSLVFELVCMTLESSLTMLAGESLDTLVLVLVHFEGSSRSKSFGAVATFEWTIIAVNIHMRGKLVF